VAACAFQPVAFNNFGASTPILGLCDAVDFSFLGPAGQISIHMLPSGAFRAYRGTSGQYWWHEGLNLGTSTNVIVTALAWHHMELRAQIGNAGNVDLYIDLDPTPWLTLSGVDTQGTANAWSDCVGISCPPTGLVDDLYSADSRMAQPDQKVLPWGLDGTVGFYNGSNPVGSAIRSENVDDPTADDDTTRNEFDVSEKDSHPSAILGSTGTIRYFIMWQRWRKNDYGPVGTQAGLRIGGTDYMSAAARYLGSDQYENVMAYDANLSPATGVEFTEAELNGAEAIASRVA
jgi:hypothetical protein